MNSLILRNSFEVLKRVLKIRGMTYADLADQLDVSEPTVKRLFVERDCKLSRLESICQHVDLSLSELLAIAERTEEPVLTLSREVEQALANSPALFYFLLLLRDGLPATTIASTYSLDHSDLHLYARDLERHGLITLNSTGHINLLSKAPIRFSPNGPLQQLYKTINSEFLCRSIDRAVQTPEAYVTISRRMRPETAKLMDEDVKAMTARIATLARQDRLSSPEEELETFKWCFANGAALFTTLFSIGPHPDKRIR